MISNWKSVSVSLLLAASTIGPVAGPVAMAETPDKNADNTGKNKRDRKGGEPTADQQKNDRSDVSITAAIRRAIVADKGLSTSAHNVKIITQDGAVTLRGPVRSTDEKAAVEKKASEVAGEAKVKSELEIKP